MIDLDRIDRLMQEAEYIVVDTETNGLLPFCGDRLIGIALYFPHVDEAFYLPVRHGIKEGVDYIEYSQYYPHELDFLKKYFENDSKIFIYHNAKFDINFMYQDGFPVPINMFDTLIASHLMNENEPHGLKALAVKYLDDRSADSDEALVDRVIQCGHASAHHRNKAKGLMWKLAPEDVAEYAMNDVKLTWQLYQFYIPKLREWDLEKLFTELCEDYMLGVIIPAQIDGMDVDLSALPNKIDMAIQERELIYGDIEVAIYLIDSSIGKFNPNSPKQVSEILNLPNAQRKTLQLAARTNPVAALIDNYKKADKVVNTFYKQIETFTDEYGTIHPDLNITGTRTGRLSCKNPNLQQYPRTTKQFNVRELFIAPEGFKVVVFDYSQLELRLACHYAKEQKMIDAFIAGDDPHQYTANELGVDRHTGKTANFGLLYGMGVDRAYDMFTSAGAVLSRAECERIVRRWRKLYPRLYGMNFDTQRVAERRRLISPNSTKRSKFIRLFTGRVRHYKGQEKFTYSAWNSLIQGTGAEVNRITAQRIAKFSGDPTGVYIVMLIHDSVMMYIHENSLHYALPKIKAIGEDFDFRLPMIFDAKVGDNWGNLK